MNVLAIGNSHLAAFKAACEALLPDCGRVQYLPSPRIVNAGDFFGGRTLVARLQFAGPDATEVAVHDPAETHLVIVGNGLFGHFAVFCPAPDRKLPCFVWSDDIAPSLPVLASCAWSSRLVSRSLFRELYADGVRHHVLQRWSMTPDFLRRFRKVTMFASPTQRLPGRGRLSRRRLPQGLQGELSGFGRRVCGDAALCGRGLISHRGGRHRRLHPGSIPARGRNSSACQSPVLDVTDHLGHRDGHVELTRPRISPEREIASGVSIKVEGCNSVPVAGCGASLPGHAGPVAATNEPRHRGSPRGGTSRCRRGVRCRLCSTGRSRTGWGRGRRPRSRAGCSRPARPMIP
jgi:hypothetical protein